MNPQDLMPLLAMLSGGQSPQGGAPPAPGAAPMPGAPATPGAPPSPAGGPMPQSKPGGGGPNWSSMLQFSILPLLSGLLFGPGAGMAQGNGAQNGGAGPFSLTKLLGGL